MNLKKVPFHGHSMNPIFRNVDFLWVDFQKTSLQLGDVLLYRDSHGELVCHRLIYKSPKAYWLKGDYSTVCDQVNEEAIFAQVKEYERNGRRVTVQNTFFIRCACWLQRQHTQSQSVIFKKFYRLGVRWYFQLFVSPLFY